VSLDRVVPATDDRLMESLGRLTRTALAPTLFAVLASACTALPLLSTSPEAVERMPGPASVWLTAEPPSPADRVAVTMTAPDPGILFAHTFDPDVPLRGVFATSQGRYLLSALAGACSLPLDLGPSDEAQVLLTVAGDGSCTLAVTWQGSREAADWPSHGDGVLITNHNVDSATPRT
jgi:hypothetical protein